MNINCIEKITLNEVALLLNKKDNRAAKKWLKEKGIEKQLYGKPLQIYKWFVDVEIQKEMVEILRKKYPSNWAQIYALNSTDQEMTNLIFYFYPPPHGIEKNINNNNVKRYI